MEEGLFHNPTFVNYINEYAVAAAGHREDHSMEERPDPLTGKVRKVCPVYDSIPCQAHQATYSQAGGSFQFRGVPASFVCDSEGKELTKVAGMSPQKFIDALKDAQMEIGKRPLTGSMLLRMQKGLFKGDSELRKGDYGDALEEYQEVAEDEEIPAFIRDRAIQRIAQLKQAAMQAVEEAKGLEDRKAKRELKKLLRDLDGLEDAKAACEEALEALG